MPPNASWYSFVVEVPLRTVYATHGFEQSEAGRASRMVAERADDVAAERSESRTSSSSSDSSS